MNDMFHPRRSGKAIKNIKEGGIISNMFLDKSITADES
jgi:hypothetical protein